MAEKQKQPGKRRQVYVRDGADWEYMRRLGNGNASEGFRRLTDDHRRVIGLDYTRDR